MPSAAGALGIPAAVRSSWALFLGIGLMMLGNRLQGSLLGLRASLEGFPTAATGILMSGYHAGFLGSALAPRLVARVGPIGAFALHRMTRRPAL